MNASSRFAGLLLALVFNLTPGALGGAMAQKPVVFYLMPTRIDEFQSESQKAIEVVLSELGYDVKSFDAADRGDLQLRQLEAAIARKPAAIVINAVDFISIIPGVAKANQARIPVLVYDRQLRQVKGQPEITVAFSAIPDAYSIGQSAGEQAGRLLLSGSHAPKGVILEISGDPGDDYSLEVQRGFLTTVPPTVSVRSRAAIGWDPGNADAIARAEIAPDKPVDLVFAHAAHLLVPLIEQLKPDKPGVLLMASNGAPIGLRHIRKGVQQVEIEQPLYAQVYGLAMGLRFVLAGRSGELEPRVCDILGIKGVIEKGELGPVLKLDGRVIDKRNIDDPASGFWGNFVPPRVKAQDVACAS